MLVPWFETPLFAELEAFRREADALLSAPLTFDPSRPYAAGRGLHLTEDEERYVLSADLPGIDLEDLEVSVKGRQLTVRARRETATPEDFETTHRERSSWRFERSISLPEPVDGDRIMARLVDGVLRVEIPRAERAQSRNIPVNV